MNTLQLGTKTLYWEDVKDGQVLPPFSNTCDLMVLNRFAGANNELVPIHMDRDASVKSGLPDVIVMGNLKLAYLGNMLENWIGVNGWVCKIAVQYRGMDMVGQTLTAKGTVKKKSREGGRYLVECDVWVENDKGQKGTLGTAVVELPSREQARASV